MIATVNERGEEERRVRRDSFDAQFQYLSGVLGYESIYTWLLVYRCSSGIGVPQQTMRTGFPEWGGHGRQWTDRVRNLEIIKTRTGVGSLTRELM